MGAPASIVDLVHRFRQQEDTYLASGYKEAQVRNEFIDPLFAALGWDMANSKGLSRIYREVIHEDSLDVSGSKRAPDYSFRIGGERKFFVEAKKPSVNVGTDPAPAFQLRRYAWSGKLPVGVVTDFEEFALYDCRQEPLSTDSASVSRLMYFKYAELEDRWDELAELLSYDAVRNGSLERYADSIRVKRGTSEVDSIFLSELERWRVSLATDIASKNLAVTERQLNFAVQQTIDRIIFLRIAEDRGIEPYGQLSDLLKGPNIYAGLGELFQQADDRYNSGLFHFRTEVGMPDDPDTFTLTLAIGDDVLRDILRRLYYPESPYEFSVIPSAILGQVYEQFLGRVIQLNANHTVTVEEKPEVRKAGGVYYTPSPIVNLIVASTISPLLEGRSAGSVAGGGRAKQRHPLRVLDPACGSGSFLLGAYEYLLRWYHDTYIADDPERWARGRSPQLRRGLGGEWQLTTSERKRILLRHIYGVDIDPQAVEVTKLSLLLKVLEGEALEEIQSQMALFQERALPDLANNILCGNSLIEPDFYYNEQMTLLSEENQTRINVFDWHHEFREVFDGAGGFDTVIGNPPYLDSETMSQFTPEWRKYCTEKYDAASGNWDVFCVFIERALNLCRVGGRHAFIVPNKLGSANYAKSIRSIVAGDNNLYLVRDYASIPVFPVSVYPIIYGVQKGERDVNTTVLYERMALNATGLAVVVKSQELDRTQYFPPDGSPWPIFADIDEASPVERLRNGFNPLSSIANVHGAATVAEAYKFADLFREADSRSTTALRVVNSGTIDPYVKLWGHKAMRYLGKSYLRPVLPKHLESQIPSKRLAQARAPKIVLAGMTKTLECVGDFDGSLLPGKSTTVVESEVDLRWLLGILNSRLVSFYYLSVFGGDRLQGGYLRIGPPQVQTLPVPTFNPKGATDVALVGHVIRLVDLHDRRLAAPTAHEAQVLARQIRAVESRIDECVYQLYELTETERNLVETSLEPRTVT